MTIYGSRLLVSSLTPDAVAALKATYRQLPKKLVDFIREQDAGLPPAASAVGRGRLPKLGRDLCPRNAGHSNATQTSY